ncbi:MAG TPA: PEP/pyruvate-binding domain-containing protein, partial [Gaiellales bacterium]|nr:PEP/pyruvate-binding domain-containing protein [Gaiellales bacterium]
MALVVPFDQLEASSLEVVGGKALNLGILAAAGFPVPPGFVVTTQAYELAVSDPAVALLAELLAAADPAPLARRLREAILGTPVPEE